MAHTPTTAEVNSLVAAGAAESVTLEFKATGWERNDQGKRECLKDISALANTQGGLILLGVREQDSAASALTPLSASDADSERSRINDLLQAGVEPRIHGVVIESVAVDGGVVLAVNVPRSATRPHRVTAQSTNRFWMRNSTGVYEANVSDLRTLFGQGAEFRDRAIRWHQDRRLDLHNGDVVPNLARAPNGLLLHLIPGDAFATQSPLDVKAIHAKSQQFWPIRASGFNPSYTFDGWLAYRPASPEGVCHGYTLVRRDGIVEAVKIGLFDAENKILDANGLEAILVKYTRLYAAALTELGVAPPIYALTTITGTREAYIARGFGESARPIARDVLPLPEAVIEDVSSDAAVGSAFRLAFDALWNASGLDGSRNFDPDGNWTGRTTEGR